MPIGVSINSTPQTRQGVRADRAGRHHRHSPRHGRAHRAAQLDHELRAELPGLHRVLRRRLSVALHARRSPHGDMLRPWIFLLVLKEDEFTRDDRRLPLPVVTVKSKERAAAVGRDLAVRARAHRAGYRARRAVRPRAIPEVAAAGDHDRSGQDLQPPAVAAAPRAEPAYHAFLVPTFEVGRLAGLGQPTTGVPRRSRPGMPDTPGVELPFYFDWSFRTGEQAGFRVAGGAASSRACSTNGSASARWIARSPGS